MTQDTGRPLQLGILGAANIAKHFAAAVTGSAKVEIVAVASRDVAKAQAFADGHGVRRALDGYEALLADPQVEAIYNPLPNSLHAEWTIRALNAGKHVLCEKPIAVNADEARMMFAAARRNGRRLAEAFPYRAQPLTLALQVLIRSGEIGRPRMIQASFGFPVANPANIRLDAALGGGALLDAGSYPVSLIHMLAGEAPSRVSASARWTESGVDDVLIANLEFPSGLLAQAACTFNTGVYRRAVIACEGGVALTDYPNHTSAEAPGLLQVSRAGWDARPEEMCFAPVSGFLAEAESFADTVREGEQAWTGMGEEESIQVMRTLDAIIASARSGRAVGL